VPESFTVTVAQPERLAGQAKAIEDAKLMGAIDALSAAVAAMREGDDPRLTLEVALLKVATPSLDSSREALLRRIESLESQFAGDAPGAASSAGRAGTEDDARAQAADEPAIELPEPAEAASPATPSVDEPTKEAEPEANVATATIEIERVVELWPAVVDHLRDSGSAMLSTLFEGARPLGIDEERSMLRIGFPASAKFNKRKAEAPANVERMTDAIGATVGRRLRPAYELIDDQDEIPAPEASAAMDEEDLIDLIKDNFDASEVVPDDDSRESEAG
jgi:DNA polymerase III gamma/tau subunit